MDEFEALERELGTIYNEYISKFRNLSYLEHQWEQQSQKDQTRIMVYCFLACSAIILLSNERGIR